MHGREMTATRVKKRRIDNDEQIILAQKPSVNGRQFITIYVDSQGSIKATILENQLLCPACLVKGIPDKIDISNKILIAQLQILLRDHCYFSFFREDVHVNIRILGGVPWGNILGFTFSAAQIASGIFVTIGTGGIGAIVGGAYIGSGINGAMYSLLTDSEQFNVENYRNTSLIGFATGAVSGGVGVGVGAASGALGGGSIPVVKAATGVVGGAIGGATGRVTGAVTEAIVYDKPQIDLTAKSVLIGAASGGIGGLINTGTTAINNNMIQQAVKSSDTVAEATLLSGLSSVTTGTAGGITTQMVSNVIDGKPIGEGIEQAALIGGAMGGMTGAAQGGQMKTAQIEQGTRQQATDSRTLVRAHALEKMAERMEERQNKPDDMLDRAAIKKQATNENFQQLATNLKSRHNTQEVQPKPIVEENNAPRQGPATNEQRQALRQRLRESVRSAYPESNPSSEQTMQQTATPTNAASTSAASTNARQRDPINLTESRDTFFAKPVIRYKPFFGDANNLTLLFEKLNIDQNSDEAKFYQKLIRRVETNRSEFPNSSSGYELTKQLGQIDASAGIEVRFEEKLPPGVDRPGMTASSGCVQIRLGKRIFENHPLPASPSVEVTKHEANIDLLNQKYKLYAHLKTLAETNDPLLQEKLKRVIRTEGHAYEDTHDYWRQVAEAKARKSGTPNLAKLANEIFERVIKLPEGEDYIISSGYSGSSGNSGHCIYHKFTMKNGQVAIKIYNGGEGCNNHDGPIIREKKCYPYSFKPLSADKQQNLKQYIETILSCKSLPEKQALPNIYNNGLNRISHLERATIQNQEKLMPIQTVGNCTWHNLTQALADNFNELEFEQLNQYEKQTCLQLRSEYQVQEQNQGSNQYGGYYTVPGYQK